MKPILLIQKCIKMLS